MNTFRNIILFAALLFTHWLSAQPAWVRDSLDILIARSMQTEQLPGLAIAVIQDGKVVLQRTYGVLEVNKPEPHRWNIWATTSFCVLSEPPHWAFNP